MTISITGGIEASGITPVSTAVGGSGTFNTVAIGVAATLALAANPSRLNALLQNMSAVAVYVAWGTGASAMTTANGIGLAPTSGSGSTITPGGSISIDRFTGDIYAISSSGTADLRYVETTT